MALLMFLLVVQNSRPGHLNYPMEQDIPNFLEGEIKCLKASWGPGLPITQGHICHSIDQIKAQGHPIQEMGQ
jgi:hypothetical protein